MKPDFAKAAREISEKTNDMVFANIDCGATTENGAVCEANAIKSYPTFFLFTDDENSANLDDRYAKKEKY